MRVQINDIDWKLDPLGAHRRRFLPQVVVECAGLLPHFIDAEDDARVEAQLERGYQASAGCSPWPLGGTIEPSGAYRYPGDPDLFPLMEAQVGQETVRIYLYGIMTITEGNDLTFAARLD